MLPETPGTTDTTDQDRRRRRWLIAGIAALAVLVIVGVVLALTLGRGGSAPAPTSSPSPSASPSASATPTPTPSGSATPEPSPSASADPEQPVPAAFTDAPTVAPGLSVSVPEITAVEGTADAPGEIAGPSLRFVVQFTNTTDAAIDLRYVAINADYGADQTPAIELEQDGSSPVPAEVPAGGTVTGAYIYNVPEDQRDLVRLLVFTTVDSPIIAFQGAGPR